MTAPILTPEEIREAADNYCSDELHLSSKEGPMIAAEDFTAGAHFALAAAESKIAKLEKMMPKWVDLDEWIDAGSKGNRIDTRSKGEESKEAWVLICPPIPRPVPPADAEGEG